MDHRAPGAACPAALWVRRGVFAHAAGTAVLPEMEAKRIKQFMPYDL